MSFYLILNMLIAEKYTVFEYFLSLTGWTSIGNSNWYIFDILVLYFITYTAFRIKNKWNLKLSFFANVVCVLVMALWIGLKLSGKGQYWYNTILAYPLGIYFSLNKDSLERKLKSKIVYGEAFVVTLSCFLVLYLISNDITFSVRACLFSLLVVLGSMKVIFGNIVLKWCGENLFSLYIMQRIPMIILSRLPLSPFAFIFLSIVITMFLAGIFSRILKMVDAVLFENRCTLVKQN